jgi:hypothetical protein
LTGWEPTRACDSDHEQTGEDNEDGDDHDSNANGIHNDDDSKDENDDDYDDGGSTMVDIPIGKLEDETIAPYESIESISSRQKNMVHIQQPSRHSIIVGVDFGAKMTSIAFCFLTTTDLGEMQVIDDWPGLKYISSHAVLSVIAYRSENQICPRNHWGNEVIPRMKSYRGMRDLLAQTSCQPSQLPCNKTAPEVCTDYLHEVYTFSPSVLSYVWALHF